ncbi:MAG TPA: hypothetical protein VG757_08515 [Devosia sp.]|nr:hypothetical protein [Devosia sp.]
MHAVVNHLPIRADADWAVIAERFEAFAKDVRAKFAAMNTAVLVRASDTEAIFVGVYDDPETAQHVSSNVAAPWFAENIRPFLSGQANRSSGPVIAGSV